jgi:hypothetical protein
MIYLGNIYAGLNSGSGGVMTLSNGLTLTGTNGVLGGALTQATTITAGAFLFTIDALTLNNLVINSTTAAFLPPRMSNAQMLAATTAIGGVIYDNTNQKLNVFNGAWQPLLSLPGGGAVTNFLTGLGGLATAANGLTMAASVLKLGGVLTGTTNIGLGGQTLHFVTNGVGPTNAGVDMTLNDATGGNGFYNLLVGSGINSSNVSLNTYGLGGYQLILEDGAGNQGSLFFDDSVFLITAFPGQSGFQDAADYSTHWNSLNYITLGYSQANYASKAQTRNASNFGQTGSLAVVATYAVTGGDQTMRVGCWVNLNAITAGTLVLNVAFTDNDGTARSLNFFDQGAAVAALSVAGYYAFPTRDFRAKTGTSVTISATFAGTSCLYDVGGEITQILGH